MSNLVQANPELALDPTDWFGSKTNLEPNPTIILNIFFVKKSNLLQKDMNISKYGLKTKIFKYDLLTFVSSYKISKIFY